MYSTLYWAPNGPEIGDIFSLLFKEPKVLKLIKDQKTKPINNGEKHPFIINAGSTRSSLNL